jgi:urease accessory protein
MDTPMLTHIPADNNRNRMTSCLYMLHISDPLTPIGGFTHSYGLETYVQKNLVNSCESAEEYLEGYLLNNFLYNDLLSAKLAWEYTRDENINELIELNNILCVSKAPAELRNASIKLGLRLIKIIEKKLRDKDIFNKYLQAVRNGECETNYSTVYGMSACLLGVPREDALCAISYGTASAIVSNCVKMIPLSQMDGQRILFNIHEKIIEIVDSAMALDKKDLGLSCIGFDIRSMQHERLYTRLYIS